MNTNGKIEKINGNFILKQKPAESKIRGMSGDLYLIIWR